MSSELDDVFQKYLSVNSLSRNYAKKLTKLINLLISKGRFLEARFYLDQLEKTHSGNIISICLGYKLAIALFDNEKLLKYDNLLFLNRKSDFEVEWYRLQYYYSVGNIHQIRCSFKFLLSNKNLNREYVETMLQVIWNIHDYELVLIVYKYIINNSFILSYQLDQLIRKIVLEKLRDSLVGYKNV